MAHLYEFGAPFIWYDTGLIRTAVSNYIQFGEKQGTTSVQFKNLLVNKKKSRNVYPRWCPCPWRWARSCRIYEIRFKAYIGGKKNRSHMWIIYHITWYQRFSFNLQNNDTNLVPKIVEIGFAYGTISWKVISKTI